jgi:L-lactate dehydrogenase complex protein LldF
VSVHVGNAAKAPTFPIAAHDNLANTQLRHNVRNATEIIRNRRNTMVAELSDWEELREAGRAIKAHTLRHLDSYLEEFERNVIQAGGHVHWARDADEANQIVLDILSQRREREVIKVKTMTSNEIELNPFLEHRGFTVHETDLADMIIQLGEDQPSHIVVPALHVNHVQVREIFERKMPLKDLGIEQLGDDPEQLTAAARKYLREKFLRVSVGISGANYAIAETGSLVVVESEGNGRMCLTLPDLLISIVGIEKVIPTYQDLEVFLQLLPRSATGERMNPYSSIWTGVTPGEGPQEFHVILLDNGRTSVLADPEGRETLQCIRCGACLNICPVYRHTGGKAYGNVYQGPIGAIVTPQLQSMEYSQTLPFASSLCGACYDVCPVKINIPEVLIHLRGKAVQQKQEQFLGKLDPENLAMQAMALVFAKGGRMDVAAKLANLGQWPFVKDDTITSLPGMLSGWTSVRDLQPLPEQTFRQWWAEREKGQA